MTWSQMAEHSDWQNFSLRCRGSLLGLSVYVCATSLSIMFGALQPHAWAQQLRITNPISIDRTEEVVEIPLDQVARQTRYSAAQLQSLVAIDVATKQHIPSQLYSSRPGADPDTLLLAGPVTG
jgi:hypothetical protein